MPIRFVFVLVASTWFAACTGGEVGDDFDCADGKCDEPPDQTCADERYGNGTCDLELTCAVPDIDCFRTFATDEEAAVWFGEFEAAFAAQEGRAPRAILPTTDPRFAKMRALLDRGWESFRKNRPVGKLAEARPALVLIDDPTVNAFVVPDLATGLGAVAVMVQTGLIALDGTDDATLGVMMHEFQHVAGLHVVGDTRDRIRKFYVAPADYEPIGKDQQDDPTVRAMGEEWRVESAEAGVYVLPELGGFMFGGQLDRILVFLIQQELQINPTGCASLAQFNQLRDDLAGSIDSISGELTVDRQTLRGRVDSTIAALRDECLPGMTQTFAQIVGPLFGVTAEEFDAQMTVEDRALVANKHVVDAIAALLLDRRSKMRDIEARFEATKYRPWSALRYFSFEEDADDVSVSVLRSAELEPTGLGEFFFSVLPTADADRCTVILARSEIPSYGVALDDEHHGTCWRINHVLALDEPQPMERRTSARTAVTPTTRPIARLPIPRQLRDVIVY